VKEQNFKRIEMKNFRLPLLLPFSAILLFAGACGEKSIEKSERNSEMSIDSAKSTIVNVSGELFSIPSPVQTALLIKESDAEFRPELLVEPDDYKSFETNAQKAMNLGLFGTDMAYSSLYENGQKSLGYFRAVDYLAKDLGVISAISPSLIKRLGANTDKPDSLVYLVSRFYEEGDAYLKENERYDIAGLILLGGWIESSYLTAGSAMSGNEAARLRLAQQKESSSTLMNVLKKTTDKNFQSNDLFQVLDSINQAYDLVSYTYVFEKPETRAEEKLTLIKSKTEYTASDSIFNSLTTLFESARKKITE
jgi:hypothetical protein